MNYKFLGYTLSVLGLFSLLVSAGVIGESLRNAIPQAFWMAAGIILVAIGVITVIITSPKNENTGGGIWSIFSKKSKQEKEVPIYEGTEIVGYRIVK